MPYPSTSLYPSTWYPGTGGPEEFTYPFDATSPQLAAYATDAALAAFLTDAALAEFVTAASLAASVTTGYYGGGLYGSGLYGTGTGLTSTGGGYDTTAPALAIFASEASAASFDPPEPSLT